MKLAILLRDAKTNPGILFRQLDTIIICSNLWCKPILSISCRDIPEQSMPIEMGM
jgi:hypothetical protein